MLPATGGHVRHDPRQGVDQFVLLSEFGTGRYQAPAEATYAVQRLAEDAADAGQLFEALSAATEHLRGGADYRAGRDDAAGRMTWTWTSDSTPLAPILDAAWEQLFHGAPGTAPDYYDGQSIYYQVSPDQAYVTDVANHDVRTEGMGYAMMIALQLGKKHEFDSLWNFAKTNMQLQDGPTKHFFAWHTKIDGTITLTKRSRQHPSRRAATC